MLLLPNLIITGYKVGLTGFFAINSSVFCGLISMLYILKKLVAMSKIASVFSLKFAIQIVLLTKAR